MEIKDLGLQLDEYIKKNEMSYKRLDRDLIVPHMTSYRWRKTGRISPYFHRLLVSKGIIKS